MPFVKDPSAILDYSVKWTDWLGSDTIATSSWSVPSGLTKHAETNNTTTATVWCSGGAVGKTYIVTNTITTAGGRTDEREIKITVQNK